MLEVGRHLRLEQAAQDLEMLARRLADAGALELADGFVDLLDEGDLDGAQRGVAAVGVDVATTTPAPFDARSELAATLPSVSAPFDAIEVVPVCPTASVLAERFVVEAPPLNVNNVVVALFGNAYPIVSEMTPVLLL